MDITLFFWDFIDYHIGNTVYVDALTLQMFPYIIQGDVILNESILMEGEAGVCAGDEFSYFETCGSLISYAGRMCEGEKLQKILTYITKCDRDERYSSMFDSLSISKK